MPYVVKREGAFLRNVARAQRGDGLDGGGWTLDEARARKYARRREAERVRNRVGGAVERVTTPAADGDAEASED